MTKTPASDRKVGMDALSDVLRAAHLTGGVFLHADFFAPWCMAARVGPEHCAPALGPASHLIRRAVLDPSRRQWKTHADDLRVPRMRLRRRKSGDFDPAIAAKTRCRARWGRRMDPLDLPICCRGGRRWAPGVRDRAGEAVGAVVC